MRLVTAHRITRRQLRATSRRLSDEIVSLQRKIKPPRVAVQFSKDNLQKYCCPTTKPSIISRMKAIQILKMQMRTGYPPFVSRSQFAGMNSTLPCRGCGLELPARIGVCRSKRVVLTSPAFKNHCLTQCFKYLALGLHRNCEICKLSFLTKKSYDFHNKLKHMTLVKPSRILHSRHRTV